MLTQGWVGDFIEQVKNELDSASETASPAETKTEEDAGSGADAAAPIDDSSES